MRQGEDRLDMRSKGHFDSSDYKRYPGADFRMKSMNLTILLATIHVSVCLLLSLTETFRDSSR